MNFDLDAWWLVAAVALFAAGWFAARVDIKLLVKDSRTLPSWYFGGLQHLLNNQPSKAIESFVEVVKERPDTLELQFALGQLFRKQGEVERATRIHQDLLDRPHLAQENRQRALYELAQDFNAAGLLDRAEENFKKLEGTPHEHASLTFLIRIYEMEKDWAQAIVATRKLEAMAKRPFSREIAQYHCELAALALVKRDFDAADTQVDDALKVNKRCVRANILRGDIASARGDASGAIAAWEAVEKQNTHALGLVAARLAKSYQDAGRVTDGIALLTHFQENYPSQDVLGAVLDLIRSQLGASAAAAYLRTELRRNPTLTGLERLLALQPPGAEKRRDNELMRDVIEQHTVSAGLYPCTKCGFRARTYYWQCPGCVNWECFTPKRQEISDVRN